MASFTTAVTNILPNKGESEDPMWRLRLASRIFLVDTVYLWEVCCISMLLDDLQCDMFLDSTEE
jgi:hypothetical protein